MSGLPGSGTTSGDPLNPGAPLGAPTIPMDETPGVNLDTDFEPPSAPDLDIAPAAQPAPPEVPTPENSSDEIAAAQEEERRQVGRAATILTGNQGVLGGLNLARRTLLGS